MYKNYHSKAYLFKQKDRIQPQQEPEPHLFRGFLFYGIKLKEI